MVPGLTPLETDTLVNDRARWREPPAGIFLSMSFPPDR